VFFLLFDSFIFLSIMKIQKKSQGTKMAERKKTGTKNKYVYKMEGKYYEVIRHFKYYSPHKHVDPNDPLCSITISYPNNTSINIDGKMSELEVATENMQVA